MPQFEILEHQRKWLFTLARVVLGIIFIVHGYTKLFDVPRSNTIAYFQSIGVPLPSLSFWLVSLLEFFGGLALVIGFIVPLVSALLVVDMIGAIIFQHAAYGFGITHNGWELPLIYIVGLVAVGAADYGVYGADNHLLKAFAKKKA